LFFFFFFFFFFSGEMQRFMLRSMGGDIRKALHVS